MMPRLSLPAAAISKPATNAGDVRVGTIVIRTGNPHDTDPWDWWCGFYLGSHAREHQSGTAATFDQARADFETAWRVFLSNRTEADFQAWRDERLDRSQICALGRRQRGAGQRVGTRQALRYI